MVKCTYFTQGRSVLAIVKFGLVLLLSGAIASSSSRSEAQDLADSLQRAPKHGAKHLKKANSHSGNETGLKRKKRRSLDSEPVETPGKAANKTVRRGAESKTSKANKSKLKLAVSPQIRSVPEGAEILLKAIQSGKITLTNGNRDQEQLAVLAKSGRYPWQALQPPKPLPAPTPSPASLPKNRAYNSGEDPQREQIDSQLSDEPIKASPVSESDSRNRVVSGSERRRIGAASPSRHAPPGFRTSQTHSESPGSPPALGAPSPQSPNFVYCTPSVGLLQMLSALSSRSSQEKPLELMSLLRPPYRTSRFPHAGQRNPHSMGMAADIASYRGLRFRQSRPQDCVQATVLILNDLPKGRYRIGMPKAPETSNVAPVITFSEFLFDTLSPELFKSVTVSGTNKTAPSLKQKETRRKRRTASKRESSLPAKPASLQARGELLGSLSGVYLTHPQAIWPFFPAPRREKVVDRKGFEETRTLFANESYAPEEALGSGRLRAAIASAKKRGVEITALFPDAADHIHVDVREH